jgi:transcriptional regulator with PAS, ATPase and Fis domain
MVKKVKSVEKTKSLEPTKKLNKVEKTKSSEIVKAKKIKEKLSKDKVIKEKVEKTAKKKKVKNEVKETNQPTGKLPSTDGSELVSSIVVKKGVDALKAATEKTQASNGKEDLFSSEHRYGLQVIATKIPKIPSHNRKM